MKKKLVVLSGAGVSAESGISTFRDSDGLWENYNVMEVASIEGWYQNPELVIDFYNQRRTQLANVEPNDAHKLIAELEQYFDVTVITQNVDDLHERSGSTQIIHLHGELTKVCSDDRKKHVEDIGYETFAFGDLAPDGQLLRPFIVWFGEDVPLIHQAAEIVAQADIIIVIGTSLNVYPAAGLLYSAKRDAQIYVIDPKEVQPISRQVHFIKEKATVGMKQLLSEPGFL
ncbi:MAG: NAD-dependent deacylase [Bacteroidetes bacterium]|nr:NAD-dependent deacylase [Bacteroidota bacterium]MCL2302342.1 NAD-dependent deacylase [Lentimicrobiaceae bacterium]